MENLGGDMTATREKVGWGAAIAATLLIFLVAMDTIMMPIASSAIVAELSADVGAIQAALSLTSLVAAPLYITGGKLGDINGKKRMFFIGMILYGIGTLAATLAPSVAVLIGGWSIVRGLGMVLALPASVGLILASYEGDQRGQAFAIYGVGGVAAALVGPLLMGFSAQALSWRVPFGLETALVVVALVVASSLAETKKVEGMTVDWGGTVLAFLAIASIILGSMLGGRYGWWVARRPFQIGGTPFNPFGLSPAPLLIGLGLVVAAVLLSRNAHMEEAGKRPLFSMKLFDNRTFLSTWAMAAILFVVSGALPFVLPVFLQQAVGFSSMQTSLVMVAFSVGSIILGFASGSLVQRFQPRTLMQIFLGVVVVGMVWLSAVVSLNATLVQFALPMFVLGTGFGVVSSQAPNITLSTLTPEQLGEGSGLAETGKELGVGLGTAVVGSILFSLAIGGVVDGTAQLFAIDLPAAERNAIIVELEDSGLPDEVEQEIAQLPAEARQALDTVVEDAYVGAMRGTLGVLVGVVLAALLVASFIPKVEPETVTAEETREAVADVSSRRI